MHIDVILVGFGILLNNEIDYNVYKWKRWIDPLIVPINMILSYI